MANETVDNLNIKLSADADKATKALNSLANSLNGISNALSKDVAGMRKFSKEIGKVTAAVREIGKVKVDVGIGNMLASLGKINDSEIGKASENIKNVASSLEKLGKAQFKESGINNTVNAINRLLKTDFSGFNPEAFQKITDSIRNLGNMPDISSGVNRFVSSLSRLANAGEKTGQSANDIYRLGQETKKAADELATVGHVSDDINMFVQSVGRLASAGGKTSQTAAGLGNLAEETKKFFKTMQDAPIVSENTIRMTQALAQLASAGGKVGSSTSTITNSFEKLSTIGTKTSSAMKKIASGIASAFKKIGDSSKHVKTAQFSLLSLAKTAVAFKVGYGLLEFGKQAFELGSDMTEVQNVVDVAFGNMNQYAYDFAKTAKEQFGISELAALKYAGQMKAILNASGVENSAAAKMSTDLTGLAGDLASFYNISQDVAWEKITSGMAGEIEPLRRLGINMSVVNLEAYAMSKGIDKSWLSMTQAEQVMLRYNYLMDMSTQQQGDFARTSGTWANQLRLLTLNIQQLATTIGQGLIAALLPALQALNVLMSLLQKAATAFRDFMYVLTGYEPPLTGGVTEDIVSGIEGIGSAGDDAAGGLGNAAGAADDLKKKLSVLPFDELNQLSDNLSDAGSGGGGSGGTGGGGLPGIGDMGSITDAFEKSELPEYINEWAERIRSAFLDHDWDRLGEEIAWGINVGIEAIYDAINWDNVGPKITAFTSAFTQTFNSLVDSINWDLMGRTIGTGINTLVNTLNQLIEGIDWINLGSSFAGGIMGIVDEVNWKGLGNLIGNYFMIAWNVFYGFITDLNFEEIGKAISDGIEGVFEKIDLGIIATALYTAFNGIFQTLGTIARETEWDKIAVDITNGLNTFIHGVNWEQAGKDLSDFVIELLDVFLYVAENTDWEEFGRNIGLFLENIDWWGILSRLFEIIKEVLTELIDGLQSTTGGKIALAIAQLIGLFKIKDITDPISSFVMSGLSALGKLPKGMKTKINPGISSMVQNIKNIFQGANFSSLGKTIQKMWNLSAKGAAISAGATAIMGEELSRAAYMASDDAKKYEALSWALSKLGDQGYISSDALKEITINMKLAQDKKIPFEQGMEDVRRALQNAGHGTEDFDNALKKAFEDMGNLAPSAKVQAEILGSGVGASITEGLIKGVTNKESDSEKAIQGLVNGAVGTFSAMAPQIEESVSQTLQAISEGISVSATQIQEVFSAMGITIPQAMAESFASMEPAVLSSTLSLLSQMNNGQALKYAELVTAFSNLGINITNEGLLQSLEGQNANVQQATIMLLSQLEAGKSLSENQLVYAFQSLGVGIVNDGIISSLANAEPSVQQQAIDLLGQIQSAADTERQPLIDKFNSLGIGTINDGLLSALNEMTPSARDEALELLSQISGASDEQRAEIYEKLKAVGIDAGSGLLEGMGSKDYNISEAGLNWAKEAIGGAKEGFDINSPSKKMKEVGNYAVDGLLQGLEVSESRIQNALSPTISYIINCFESLKTDLYNLGQGAIQSFINGFRSMTIPMPHITVSGWNQLALGNGGIMSIPNFGVNWYAAGGLFRNATIAGIGEDGDEAVLPLENRRTMRMISDSIIDNSSGGFGMNEEAMANAVARGVAMAMMNNQSSQPNITVYAELRTEDDEVLARAVARGQEKMDYRMNPTAKFGY